MMTSFDIVLAELILNTELLSKVKQAVQILPVMCRSTQGEEVPSSCIQIARASVIAACPTYT